MKVYYELMDLDSANVIGFFDSKDEAFATVRESYESYGPAGVEDMALSEKSNDGWAVLVGEGEELARMAGAPLLSQVAG